MEQQPIIKHKYNGGRWTKKDQIRLFKMTLKGYSDLHIANRLGRTVKAIPAQRTSLRSCGWWYEWLATENLELLLLFEDVPGDFNDI